MNADDLPESVRYQIDQIIGQHGLKLSDPELNELAEHLVAFERRAEIIRSVKIDQSEVPALRLFVESPGGDR